MNVRTEALPNNSLTSNASQAHIRDLEVQKVSSQSASSAVNNSLNHQSQPSVVNRVAYMVNGNSNTQVHCGDNEVPVQRLYVTNGVQQGTGCSFVTLNSANGSARTYTVKSVRQTPPSSGASDASNVSGYHTQQRPHYMNSSISTNLPSCQPSKSCSKSTSTSERRQNSRSNSKKEQMDPKNVEEEVARSYNQLIFISFLSFSSLLITPVTFGNT
ncbi:hypothetical protein AB6A40_010561 [Gnathostoma spinigerum]|uniref:Uncharacterized protein n=1 Tax=Gnathostoma spinigerum TaxID=75299 RepID=A0ABD6F2P1_9BILA